METLLRWLCTTSVQVAVLVLVVLAAERLLARWLAPRWRYALWLVVLVRLFLPGLPELPRGAVDWRRAAPAAPRATAGGPRETSAPAAPLAAPPAPASGSGVDERPDAGAELAPAPAPVPAAASLAGAPAAPPTPARAPRLTLARLAPGLCALWAAVALALLARDAARELAFRRRLGSAAPVTDAALRALFADCCRLAGCARPPLLLATDLVASPAAMGWRRPAVLLPHAVARGFGADELRRVFLHELAHLKSRDVPLNAVLVLAGRAYWFHPLVALALRRLRAAQESARDFEALALAREADPVPYARTLLRLCEELPAARRQPALSFLSRESSLKGRIVMLTRFARPTFATSFLGLGLLAGLAWLAFTTASAAVPPQAGGEGGRKALDEGLKGYLAARDRVELSGTLEGRADAPASNVLAQVRVERQTPPEAWRAPLAERLARTAAVDFRAAPVRDVLEHVRRAAGVEVVVEPDSEELLDRELSLAGDELSAEQVLDLLVRAERDLDWCKADGAVHVGYRGSLREPLDLRFYNTGALLPADLEDGGAVEEAIQLLQELSGPGWDEAGTSIESWRGLIVVRQTDAVHARVEQALNRMLNRGARPPIPEPRWRAHLAEALARKVSVSAEDADPAELARGLGLAQHAPVVVPTELNGATQVTVDLKDVALGDALQEIARRAELAAFPADGALVLEEHPPVETEFFEIKDLVQPRPGAEDINAADGLIQMVMSYVDPGSWDRPECNVHTWRDLLVVRQSRGGLDGTRDLLDAARRASEH